VTTKGEREVDWNTQQSGSQTARRDVVVVEVVESRGMLVRCEFTALQSWRRDRSDTLMNDETQYIVMRYTQVRQSTSTVRNDY
jgi:hypothetical protein